MGGVIYAVVGFDNEILVVGDIRGRLVIGGVGIDYGIHGCYSIGWAGGLKKEQFFSLLPKLAA